MKKILIIRFSSLGDIVLTSPILRCLKTQSTVELHFLTKKSNSMVLLNNPYIDKLIFLKELQSTIYDLRIENYDLIIDLHNNLRSFWIKLNLRVKSITYSKKRLKRFFFINFGVPLLKEHIVDMYFGVINKLGLVNDKKGLDYFLPANIQLEFNTEQDFICWSIGASYETKKLSTSQIVNVCNKISRKIVLIGGENELQMGQDIVDQTTNTEVINFCGLISIDQSALLIKKSRFVLTNDTGMMHIAAALNKHIISFWGCTKPALGFWPYLTRPEPVNIVYMKKHRPCSKHGKSCRWTKSGCVKKINPVLIMNEIEKIIKLT